MKNGGQPSNSISENATSEGKQEDHSALHSNHLIEGSTTQNHEILKSGSFQEQKRFTQDEDALMDTEGNNVDLSGSGEQLNVNAMNHKPLSGNSIIDIVEIVSGKKSTRNQKSAVSTLETDENEDGIVESGDVVDLQSIGVENNVEEAEKVVESIEINGNEDFGESKTPDKDDSSNCRLVSFCNDENLAYQVSKEKVLNWRVSSL